MSQLDSTPSGNFVSPPQSNVKDEGESIQIVNPDETPEEVQLHDVDNAETKILDSSQAMEVQESKIPSKTFILHKSRFWMLFYQYRGIALSVWCSIFTSFAGLTVKYLLGKNYKPSFCLLWRCPGLLVFSFSEMIYKYFFKKENIFDTLLPCSEREKKKTFLIMILSRILLGPLMILCQFYSFRYIDLGDAQTIIYSNSVFVTFFAHFILHESWGIVPMVASLVTIVGVMIISKPSFITGETDEEDERIYGIILAVVAMFLNTFIYITMRFLCLVNSSITLFVISLSTVVLGLGMTIAEESYEMPREWMHTLAFMGLVICTLLGTASFTIALQYEEAGMISLVRCLDVVLSFFWQMLLGTNPDYYSLGGATLVISCIAVVFFRKYLIGLPPEHRLAKYCCCLMK